MIVLLVGFDYRVDGWVPQWSKSWLRNIWMVPYYLKCTFESYQGDFLKSFNNFKWKLPLWANFGDTKVLFSFNKEEMYVYHSETIFVRLKCNYTIFFIYETKCIFAPAMAYSKRLIYVYQLSTLDIHVVHFLNAKSTSSHMCMLCLKLLIRPKARVYLIGYI